MFSKAFQRKYALTDQGLKNTKSGAFWDRRHQPGGHGRHGHPFTC